MVTLLNAEGTNVYQPDEDEVAQIFNNLRALCPSKLVSNLFKLFFIEIYP